MRISSLVPLCLSGLLIFTACTPLTKPSIQLKPGPPGPKIRADASYPAWVKREMETWYASLPSPFLSGARNVRVLFRASDGKIYPTHKSLKFQQGRVVKSKGQRNIIYRGGRRGATLPQEKSKSPKKYTPEYTCDGSDGPYYRSWSKTGYAGLYSELKLDQTPYLPKVFGRTMAAYSYVGAQIRGRDVDAGLVYMNKSLRLFVTNPNAPDHNPNVVEQYWEASPGLQVGQRYPIHFHVDGQGGYMLRLDTPQGTILANKIASNLGTNYLGEKTYFKRAVSIASSALGSYQGRIRYNAVNYASHRNSKLLTYGVGKVRYQPYAMSKLHRGGCRWPNSRIVQVSAGGAPKNDVVVKIDLKLGR